MPLQVQQLENVTTHRLPRTTDWEEEGSFKAKAVNEVDAATPPGAQMGDR